MKFTQYSTFYLVQKTLYFKTIHKTTNFAKTLINLIYNVLMINTKKTIPTIYQFASIASFQ